jgi:hypothetical protein
MADLFQSRSKGGIARRDALPQARRSAIAKKAALARWGVKATHRGSFKEHFGVDVECYVLDDEEKTAVISQTGMARVLGLSPRGNSFPNFMNSQAMAAHVGGELRGKLENPIKFQWASVGGGTPPVTTHGFDSALLIDVCNAIVAADAQGAFKAERYKTIVHQAHIIMGATAKSGIRNLVYSLAGYSPSAAEVIAAFKLYVSEEARKYEPEFPNELYLEWYRLYGLDAPERGRPWHFKHLTVSHVYIPLARSNGKILELLRALKERGGNRHKKLFQFLNEIGARALRIHLGRILEMAESSPRQADYERRVARRFGDQLELDLEPTLPIV